MRLDIATIPFGTAPFREGYISSWFTVLIVRSFYERLSHLHNPILQTQRLTAYKVIEANLPRHSLLASLVDRANLTAPHLHPLTFRENSRYNTKSPNCKIYKALYPEVVRLEGLRLLKYAI
jgi:hypothetical protein